MVHQSAVVCGHTVFPLVVFLALDPLVRQASLADCAWHSPGGLIVVDQVHRVAWADDVNYCLFGGQFSPPYRLATRRHPQAQMWSSSCFSSRQLAEAYYAEIDHSESRAPGKSFEQFAETVRELFPSALSAYAHLGRTIFEVLIRDADDRAEPARSTKVGRNDPCPCGSGKKYKKCCFGKLH